jgi:hypothetical protein
MASGCPMGLVAGPGWTGRAHGLIPVGKDKICFFEIIFSKKQIQGIPENAYKARKILRKSQKF